MEPTETTVLMKMSDSENKHADKPEQMDKQKEDYTNEIVIDSGNIR